MSDALSGSAKTGGFAWGWFWALVLLVAFAAFAIYTPFVWFAWITGILGLISLWGLLPLITEWGNISKEGGLGIMFGLCLGIPCALAWLVRIIVRQGLEIHLDVSIPPLMQYLPF